MDNQWMGCVWTGGQEDRTRKEGSWIDGWMRLGATKRSPPYIHTYAAYLDSCDQVKVKVQQSSGCTSLSADEEHSLPEMSGEAADWPRLDSYFWVSGGGTQLTSHSQAT
jgi:hypothetical protein